MQQNSKKNQLAHQPFLERFTAWFLLIFDSIIFFLILSVFFWFRYAEVKPLYNYDWQRVIAVVILNFLFYTFELHRLQHFTSRKLILSVTGAVFIGGVLISLYAYFSAAWVDLGVWGRLVLWTSLFIFSVYAVLIRLVFFHWLKKQSRSIRWLVLGDENIEVASYFWALCSKYPNIGESVYLKRGDKGHILHPQSLPVFVPSASGNWEDFDGFLEQDWSGIILLNGKLFPDEIMEKLMHIRMSGIKIYDFTDFAEQFWNKVPVYRLHHHWFAMSHGFNLLHNRIELRLKRLGDILTSVLFLILSFPSMVLLAVAIKLTSSGPIFYIQDRVGRNEAIFKIYKFRSMGVDAESQGIQWASRQDLRVTRVGKLMRKFRLDELPQLWNILKGDMSFIGPRPERPEFTRELEREISFYALRHLVKPGLTGWAQIKYPYGASVDDAREKLEYDLYYIKNYSLILDLVILLKTTRVILSGFGGR